MFKVSFKRQPVVRNTTQTSSGFPFLSFNHISKYSLGIAICFAFIFSYFKLTAPDAFPIQQVQIVDPLQRVNHHLLKSTVMPEIEHGFFHVNVKRIQEEVSALPWVHEAFVRRVWPNKVVITIQEQKPLARWNQGQLVTAEGQVFTPDSKTMPQQGLPFLLGQTGEEHHAVYFYQTLQNQLKPLSLAITQLKLSSRHDVELVINDSFRLDLGEEDQEQRLEAFVRVYPSVFSKRFAELESVNMQYNRGMAVEWKHMA